MYQQELKDSLDVLKINDNPTGSYFWNAEMEFYSILMEI